MPGIRMHHTEVSDAEWDGEANKARLRNDGDEAYYRSAFAWQDPDGDPSSKSSYKFIHHFVGEDGTVGPASSRACSSGIAVLNGGRAGTNIPDSDRKAVWNHLSSHLRDADMEPPELNAFSDVERRLFQCKIETRNNDSVDDSGNVIKRPVTLSGYAAIFNSLSEEMWGFRERIAPGAFKKTIQEADIRAFWNHNTDVVLGRTRSNTLRLEEDETGLRTDIYPPDTALVREMAIEPIARGDVDQMSFGFQVIRDSWDVVDDMPIRTLLEVRLFEVSPVAIPAYSETKISLRTLERVRELREQHSGEPEPAGNHSPEPTPVPTGNHLDDMRMRLSLAQAQLVLWRTHERTYQGTPVPCGTSVQAGRSCP